MKKSFLKLALLSLAIAAVPAVRAAQVDVTWNDPQTFRDIEAANSTRAYYQERVLSTLEQHFREAGAQLPEGQTLAIKITDVDLAGTVEYFHPGYPFGVRLVRNIDFPRLSLDYVLFDSDGKVISSGSDKLSDLGFRFPVYAARYIEPLDYEKRMIERWYSKKFGRYES